MFKLSAKQVALLVMKEHHYATLNIIKLITSWLINFTEDLISSKRWEGPGIITNTVIYCQLDCVLRIGICHDNLTKKFVWQYRIKQVEIMQWKHNPMGCIQFKSFVQYFIQNEKDLWNNCWNTSKNICKYLWAKLCFQPNPWCPLSQL